MPNQTKILFHSLAKIVELKLFQTNQHVQSDLKLNDHLMDALRYALYSFQPSDNRQPQASPAWRPSYLGDLDILSGTVESKTAVKAINNSNRFASQETGYREAVKASPIINPYQL